MKKILLFVLCLGCAKPGHHKTPKVEIDTVRVLIRYTDVNEKRSETTDKQE